MTMTMTMHLMKMKIAFYTVSCSDQRREVFHAKRETRDKTSSPRARFCSPNAMSGCGECAAVLRASVLLLASRSRRCCAQRVHVRGGRVAQGAAARVQAPDGGRRRLPGVAGRPLHRGRLPCVPRSAHSSISGVCQGCRECRCAVRGAARCSDAVSACWCRVGSACRTPLWRCCSCVAVQRHH
jgi:hypothetical protein